MKDDLIEVLDGIAALLGLAAIAGAIGIMVGTGSPAGWAFVLPAGLFAFWRYRAFKKRHGYE